MTDRHVPPNLKFVNFFRSSAFLVFKIRFKFTNETERDFNTPKIRNKLKDSKGRDLPLKIYRGSSLPARVCVNFKEAFEARILKRRNLKCQAARR